MDPDYDGYCIGGWSGEIIALDTWEQTPMALIAWNWLQVLPIFLTHYNI
jgi:hypothetical protein